MLNWWGSFFQRTKKRSFQVTLFAVAIKVLGICVLLKEMKKPQEIKTPYGIMHDDGSLGRLQKVSQKSKSRYQKASIEQSIEPVPFSHLT